MGYSLNFGKKIKTLTASQQYLSFDILTNPVVNCQFISNINSLENPMEADIGIIDIGFFNERLDSTKKYFMLLNRYYSTLDRFQIKLRDFTDFSNWKLTDYIENTSQTLVINNLGNTSFNDTITKGDARLYSVLPVIKYGGNLIADETISAPTTLHEDMTIESGATL